MPLIITFGINGSGKDTLAKQLFFKDPTIRLLSGSRIMLRGLGFDVGITVDSAATKEMYQVLEQTPEYVKQNMTDEVFKNTLIELKNNPEIAILSSHLVIARRNGEDIIYELNLVRDWFNEVFDGFVFVKSNPEEIYRRHIWDMQNNIRDRGLASIESLKAQQELSDQEWQKLQVLVPKNKTKLIYNFDGKLEESAHELQNFIKSLTENEKEKKFPFGFKIK